MILLHIIKCNLQVANWRMERLEVDSKSNSEEEFFDCVGKLQNRLMFAKIYKMKCPF